MLPQELSLFERLKKEAVGNVFIDGFMQSAEMLLKPSGRTVIGPMQSPLPFYVVFKPRDKPESSPFAFGASSHGGKARPLEEGLIEAGIHGLLLLDPRVYICAEKLRLLSSQQNGSGKWVASYDVALFGPKILGMPEKVASAAKNELKGNNGTTELIVTAGSLEIRTDAALEPNQFVRYQLPV